jgi:glyoxylase-like metal-dependent hydrolase (beta-lactamase superfamily II)
VTEPRLIDLRHLGGERVIGAYLLDTPDGPALHDCGPATTVDALRSGLAEHGVAVTDLRHLLLSHIHFDHAGAAGVLVRENPRLTVHVSEIGAPHLVDPSRLEHSARRIYLDHFERLWGSLVPIPQDNVRITGARVLDFECFPSPGHASHHVCYLRDGILYAGDAAGVRIAPSQIVMPPTPPPDVDLDAWDTTFDEIERHAPERLALIHFGVFDDVVRHLATLRERLHRFAAFVRDGATEDEFVAMALHELGEEASDYDNAFPPLQDFQGLTRYWTKRRERAGSRSGKGA